jgi:hypothetical protein
VANEYVASAAIALVPVVDRLVNQFGGVSAADVRLDSKGIDLIDHNEELLYSERASVITMAFRLAGLQPTDQFVPNQAPQARGRKVRIWVR